MDNFPARQGVLLNPGGGPIEIDDLDALLAEHHSRGEEPMIDVGGDTIVSLQELVYLDDDGEYDE